MNGVGNSEVIRRQEQLTVLGHLVREGTPLSASHGLAPLTLTKTP